MRMASVVILKVFIGFGFLKPRCAMCPERNRAALQSASCLADLAGEFNARSGARPGGGEQRLRY